MKLVPWRPAQEQEEVSSAITEEGVLEATETAEEETGNSYQICKTVGLRLAVLFFMIVLRHGQTNV